MRKITFHKLRKSERLADTSSRTHWTSERSPRRALTTVRPVKTTSRRASLPNVADRSGRDFISTARSSQGAGKGIHTARLRKEGRDMRWSRRSCQCWRAFVNGLVAETPGTTGLVEVEMAWLSEFRKQPTAATDVGRLSVRPEGEISPHSCTSQDAHSRPLLSQKMRRVSTSWYTSSAKSFSIARRSSRKALHRRRTTSGNFRVNWSSAAGESRASTFYGRAVD